MVRYVSFRSANLATHPHNHPTTACNVSNPKCLKIVACNGLQCSTTDLGLKASSSAPPDAESRLDGRLLLAVMSSFFFLELPKKASSLEEILAWVKTWQAYISLISESQAGRPAVMHISDL